MAAPYILAHTFAEAHRFAQSELGLDLGHYRVVNSSGSLKAVRGVNLYLVPGWRKRFDRFTMQSAIRWTRMIVIDVEELQAQESAKPLVAVRWADTAYTRTIAERYNSLRGLVLDGLQPAGIQLTLVDSDEATAFLLTADADTTPVDVAPAPADVDDKVRRRRRCKECGLLVEPDDLDAHNAEHLPESV